MASYNVVFKPSVGKDLRSLPKAMVVRVLKQIEALKENPFPPQSVKLAGASGYIESGSGLPRHLEQKSRVAQKNGRNKK